VNTISDAVLELPEMINAIWKSKDGDYCVTIRGQLGVGADGRDYVSVLNTETGLPLDELEFWDMKLRNSSQTNYGEDDMFTHSPVPIEKQPIWEYRATIPAAVGAITTVMNAVMEVGEQTDCFKGKELEIETALREALANAIVHGCRNDECQSVQVSVSCDQDHEIEMVVRDSGPGFDSKSIPDPTTHQNLHATCGRGLFLIQQLMDEVRHERGGTEIFMRKR
jgi:serine/threonine-protein kinase RsbW